MTAARVLPASLLTLAFWLPLAAPAADPVPATRAQPPGAGLAKPRAAHGPTLKGTACAGRGPDCRIVRVQGAGTGADGVPLTVAEIGLGLADKPGDAPDDGCREAEGPSDGGREYWLIEGEQAPRKLFALCNDGYGASGVGEDTVTIAANRLTHVQAGGSAWRWSEERSVQLHPPQLLETDSCSYSTVQPASGRRTRIEHPALRVRLAVMAAADEAQTEALGSGCPPAASDWNPQPAPGVRVALALPLVPAEAGGLLASGQTLGSCALALAGNGAPGYLVHGRPDPQRHAELRVLAGGPDTLYVQLLDPGRPAPNPATNWVHRDHLELWLAPQRNPDAGEDPRPDAAQLVQIGLTPDGKTFAGLGKPPLPKVERWDAKDAQDRPLTVLKLVWPQPVLAGGALLVYSQADNDRQSRLLATAGLIKNRPQLLPAPQRPAVRCKVVDGALDAEADGSDPFAR